MSHSIHRSRSDSPSSVHAYTTTSPACNTVGGIQRPLLGATWKHLFHFCFPWEKINKYSLFSTGEHKMCHTSQDRDRTAHRPRGLWRGGLGRRAQPRAQALEHLDRTPTHFLSALAKNNFLLATKMVFPKSLKSRNSGSEPKGFSKRICLKLRLQVNGACTNRNVSVSNANRSFQAWVACLVVYAQGKP